MGPVLADRQPLGALTAGALAPPAAVGLGAAAAGAYAAAAPSAWPHPGCPLHALTGLWCPFCGATRALAALAHGHAAASLADDAALVPLLVFAAVAWVGWAGARAGRWAAPSTAVVWRAGAVSLLAFGVARNLPWFAWLAPH